MSWPQVWKNHLKVKIKTLAILLAAGLLLSGLLWLLYQLSLPLLPQAWQAQISLWQHQPQGQMALLKQQAMHDPFLPLSFVGFQVLQVLLAPIPGQFMGLLGGWLFGFWGGLSLTMLGLSLGSVLAMLIGRYGGRWLIDRLLSHALLERFDHMVESSGLFTFFMLFLLPALPDDALCLVAGMTPLRLPWLLGACILGRLPGMAVLSWVGTEMSQPHWSMQLVLALLGLISFGLWLFQDPLEMRFAHWSRPKQRS
ncbi:MAG: hypothetical protein CVV27_06315 [Candidatus Melainabacteria bacterium HGW-Melainabacteria-1]|nr:MAG: hypothetical protein CVV27_06315 [Candidatus Melainabacteria bacterium HGW-Melainabacteria-1]